MSDTIKKLIESEVANAEATEDQPAPESVKPTARGHARAVMLSVRLNPEENQELLAAAENADLPVSTYVRSLILDALRRESASMRVSRVNVPPSGLPVALRDRKVGA